MQELPFSIQKSIRMYEPIETEGLTLYPVRVSEWEEFLAARPALEAMQQSFPVALMRMPILSAFFRMNLDAAARGLPIPGLFERALLGLALSLRLWEGQDMDGRVRNFRYRVDPKDPAKLLEIGWDAGDGAAGRMTPAQYQRFRPLIAAQNGVEMPSENANPDLVEAERQMAELSGAKLSGGVEDLVSASAVFCRTDEAEIYRWPIRKLTRRAGSVRRLLDFLICGAGETQGTTWKGGNPCPDPFFPRKRQGSAALSALDSLYNGAGARAARNAGARVT